MPEPSTAELRIPEARALLALAIGVIVIAALYVAKEVFIPITLAVILSFILSPLVNLLGRLGLWRAPAVVASVLVALGVIGLIATLLGTQASTLADNAPQYAETIGRKIDGAQTFATARFDALARLIPGVTRPPAAAPPAPVRTPAGRARSATPASPTVVEVAPQAASPFAMAGTIIKPVVGPLETTVIVIVVAIFILIQKEDLRDRFIRLVGSSDLNRTTLAIDDAGQRLSRYFVSQLAVNTTFGIVIGVGLWAIGIPSPAVWGVLAGVLRFVPYVGPILAAIAPLALAAGVDPGWTAAVYVGLLFVVVEPITGYVVEPLLYGHSTGLSPISVIVAALFWTWLWGPMGLILSTPLTLCLVVVGRHAKPLEFFDVLLGDRPALPAADRIYQRILSGDLDDILAHAEAYVAGHSLVEYYDCVALPALVLAAHDEARGSLEPTRVEAILRLMTSIVDELGRLTATRNGEPPAARDGVVACVAGRGCLDEVVAAMLEQLLTRDGFRTERVPHHAVSRAEIGGLDLTGVSAVAIAHLELNGSPPHLRYLVDRVRHQAPAATLVVGMWPAGDAMLSDDAARKSVGADRYTGSLGDTIAALSWGERPPFRATTNDDSASHRASVRSSAASAKATRAASKPGSR
jgi:predicted PurR-regulated permease PerM